MDLMESSRTARPPEARLLSRLLGGSRAIVASALALIVALAWVYLLTGAGTGMNPFAMTAWLPPFEPGNGASTWTPAYAVLMVLMWWVMMIAMMLPSATPFILIHARVAERAKQAPTASFVFLAGYLLIWFAFSLAAAFVQWSLEASGLLDAAMMWPANRWLSAALLAAAGLYQLTPAKGVCLSHCRSPVHYLSAHWRTGHAGALRMGLSHGAYCLGCCWLLMALLFVGGAMNLLWIAGLSIVVLIEKLLPAGPWFGRLLGVLLLAGSISMVAAAAPL
jgi:predicted metal-binding membrane protein